MPHTYIAELPVEQFAMLRETLDFCGWTSCLLVANTEVNLRGQLQALGMRLGVPVATRVGGDMCEMLCPTEAESARSHSLSKLYSLGEFPLHVDTAHWLRPCRYLILACLSPGCGNRPTVLLDTRQLPLSCDQTALLYSTPFRVTNSRNSFFSTILTKTRLFVRYDPGCMTPVTPDGTRALDIFSRHRWPGCAELIDWQIGKVLVIDNWRVLHGRGNADCPDPTRKLLRISIQ